MNRVNTPTPPPRSFALTQVHLFLAILLGIVPLLPLLDTGTLYLSVITEKAFAFRLIVGSAGVLWLTLCLVDPSVRPVWTRSTILLILILTTACISTAFGVDPIRGFLGTFERMEGITALCYGTLYALIATCVYSRTTWNRAIAQSVLVSGIIALMAILDSPIWSFDVLSQATMGDQTRISGIIGNPGFFALYTALHIPLALIAFDQTKSRLLRCIFCVIVILLCLATWWSGTRGAILGLLIGSLVFASPITQQMRVKGVSGRVYSWVLGAIFLGAIALSLGGIERITQTSLHDTTVSARLINLTMSFEGWKERPIWGWGLEGYSAVSAKFYDPMLYREGLWFDRAHNIIADISVTRGIVGLILTILLFASLIFTIIRTGVSYFTQSALLMWVVVYLVTLLFWFDFILSTLMFMFVCGYIAHLERKDVPGGNWGILQKSIACTILLSIGWLTNAQFTHIKKAYLLEQARSPIESGVMANHALLREALHSPGMGQSEVRYTLADMTLVFLEHPLTIPEVKSAYTELSVQELTKETRAFSQDPRGPYYLGRIHSKLQLHEAAEAAFLMTLSRTPRKQVVLFELADVYLNQGRSAEALELLRNAYHSAPLFMESQVRYGVLSVMLDSEEDMRITQSTFERVGTHDTRVIQAYHTKKKYHSLSRILEREQHKYPDNLRLGAQLALTYFFSDQYKKGVDVIENLSLVHPEMQEQGQALIWAIDQGTLTQSDIDTIMGDGT
jgi:O-antigen ligase/tetratricopeptide (TPR) repeat protein